MKAERLRRCPPPQTQAGLQSEILGGDSRIYGPTAGIRGKGSKGERKKVKLKLSLKAGLWDVMGPQAEVGNERKRLVGGETKSSLGQMC